MAIPTLLIHGSSAASRSDYILDLVADHRSGNRWAVFAAPTAFANPARRALPPDLAWVHAPFGCVCCDGHLPFRVELNRLLRHRPDRLLIELAVRSHVLDVIRTLRGEWLRDVVDVVRIIDLDAGASSAPDWPSDTARID